jgi:hypothetical protein
VKYREHGVTVKAGVIRYLGANFFLDVNSGITWRNIHYYKPLFTREFNDEAFFFLNIPNEENRTGFSPSLCARLGYRLK